jgi:hypothetical protein
MVLRLLVDFLFLEDPAYRGKITVVGFQFF